MNYLFTVTPNSAFYALSEDDKARVVNRIEEILRYVARTLEVDISASNMQYNGVEADVSVLSMTSTMKPNGTLYSNRAFDDEGVLIDEA